MIGRLKFSIGQLVNEMLDQLPQELFESSTTTFIDPCMGGGQFVREIESRLRQAGHPDDNIAGRVFGFETNALAVNYAVNKHELVGQYRVCENFVELKMKRKFDCVLGNPPYLKGRWRKFVAKMIKLSDGWVLTVNPDPTRKLSDFGESFRQELLAAGVQVRKECTEHFPKVSSGTISYFVMNKHEVPNETCLEDHSTVGHILRKVLARKDLHDGSLFIRVGHPTYQMESRDRPDNEFGEAAIQSLTKDGMKVRYMRSQDLPRKSCEELCHGRFLIMNRFFGKNNPDPLEIVEDMENYRGTLNVILFRLGPKDTIEAFRSVFGSGLYRVIMSYMRQGGFDIQTNFLEQLPRLDLGRTWTDQELYQHFSLTEEEIQYIEETIE